jgi:hypothetical protein
VTDGIWERDNYEQDPDGIIDPEDELSEDSMDTVLEQGYSPPERPLAIRQVRHDPRRGARRRDPRPAPRRGGAGPDMEVDLVEGEPAVRAGEGGDVPDDIDYGSGDIPDNVFEDGVVDDGEVGDARAGRLVDPDQGGTGDAEKDLIGYDVGIDGAGAGAEEAAMHVVDYTEATPPSSATTPSAPRSAAPDAAAPAAAGNPRAAGPLRPAHWPAWARRRQRDLVLLPDGRPLLGDVRSASATARHRARRAQRHRQDDAAADRRR